jgi:hypothetical protein
MNIDEMKGIDALLEMCGHIDIEVEGQDELVYVPRE